ncbi:MAG: hypothetical protein HYS40_00870 [Gemmatimonadetes bacterium]|nr:hypothetical protein [Gemmatimonadota bacterium]
MLSPEALIATGAVVLLGSVAILARSLHQKRLEVLASYCLARGFALQRERGGAEEAFREIVPVFKRGHHKSWGYTITGRWNGRPFTAFEYSYVVSTGKSSHTRAVRVLLWEAEGVTLPRFLCTPEGFWNRLGQKFGVQDFDFLEDTGFSSAYQLQGDDEAAVRARFTPEIRAFLAAQRGHHLAGGGKHLFWWQDGRLPKPEELDGFLAEGDGIRRLFLT